MKTPMCPLYLAWLLCLLWLALAAGCTARPATPAQPAPCEEAFTFAPASYVIDVILGEAVILDPVAHDFQLFCTPGEAMDKVATLKRNGRLTEEGEWRAYKVYGTLAEVGTEVEPGVYMLNRPAPLVDWAD